MRETRKKKARSTQGGIKILVAILVILAVVAAVLFAMKVVQDNKPEESKNNNTMQTPKEDEKKPEPKTFAGNERPIAFMIDNNINAMPQAGLEQADLIYEIIVEGGETRLMMVMKDKELKKIGPVRSSRHYFIDYAMENDAIYIHYGHSPQAGADFKKFGIDHVEGVYESVTGFWRDNTRYAPHNAVISTAKLEEILKREKFRRTSDNGNVLNYVAEEVELEDKKEITNTNNTNSENIENKTVEKVTNLANTVTIPYSAFNTVKYTYNKESKTYTRYSRDKVQKDWNTNKAIAVKNIIVTKCANSTIDSYGRQTIDNVKILDGYYITNGKYIPIKCVKTSRTGKTVYKDLEGNEIKVNDGKTFIQICPIESKISFK